MTAKNFSDTMVIYKGLAATVDKTLNDVYDLLGVDMVELLDSTSYEVLLRNVIATEIADQSLLTADEVEEDLAYLMYECNFDLGKYCENVTIDVNGEAKHPILSTWEDYFNYLIRKD